MSKAVTTTESTSDQAANRKAYGEATSMLREAHREEFMGLLRARQDALGVVVRHRKTAAEVAAEKAAAEAARAAKVEAKRLAKIAALKAEIEALSDPMDVFREPIAV